MVKRSYAVVWSNGAGVDSGRLEPGIDRLQLVGRDDLVSILYSDLADVTIARGQDDRLRGLPVLLLLKRTGSELKVASLEGAAVLHELMEHIVETGLLTVVA